MSHDLIHSAGKSDLDEDLFDFAGISRDPGASEPEEDLEGIFASLRDDPPAEDLLAVPAAPATAPLRPAPASAPAAHRADEPRTQAPLSPARLAAKLAKDSSELRPAAPELVPAARSWRFSKGAVAIALAVTVLNSGLAVVMLRGRKDDGGARLEGRMEPEHREHDALAAPPRAAQASLPDPEAVDAVHDHPALDEARAQISRGEYAAARQRVYALLAIIDRLEEPRRGALEGDCQFLVAQSLHLEALARMGGTE